MAGPSFDTDALIANVKRRCAVPNSQLTYLPADFTDLANDELQGRVVPLIMSTREEYFVDFVDVQATDGEVEIPSDAVGSKLRTVAFVTQTSPLVLVNLPRIDLDVVAGLGYCNYAATAGFYVQGNTLKLYPPNSTPLNSTIRLYYYKRTLALAAPSTYGEVVSVNSGTNTLQLSFVPSDWEAGTTLNAVSGTAPFATTSTLMTISGVSSPSVIVDSVEGVSVGDFVSLEGYSAIPQVPLEAHAWLAQLTAVKVLEGLGDREAMKAADAMAERLEKSMLTMISQRVDGSVKKVINPSGGLRIAAGMRRSGYGRF
jgi:hypothetical protein